MSKKVTVTVIVAVLLALGALARRFLAPPAAPPIQNAMFQQLDADGLKAVVAKNHVTLVNMWASWCGPCKEEFPSLIALHHKYENKGLGVVLLSVDLPSGRSDANAFLREEKVDFVTYFAKDPMEETVGLMSQNRWQGGIPMTLLFDSTGKILDSWLGDRDLPHFEAKISPLLAK